ncbi:hypothetical protein T11_9772 [Trichinella zimbabwensis]|uniref:Uncharacterized protein n=1 Tax=Trichinella zimbabwensis TaxID=268475 RepID=A0A0V1I4K7_9BILA|nr:hypothetical protein T11_9772 [Trichinella zimbabwensis]
MKSEKLLRTSTPMFRSQLPAKCNEWFYRFVHCLRCLLPFTSPTEETSRFCFVLCIGWSWPACNV